MKDLDATFPPIGLNVYVLSTIHMLHPYPASSVAVFGDEVSKEVIMLK